jgi:hypothetical protein
VAGRKQRKFGLDWPATALNLIFRTNKAIVLAQFFDKLTEEYDLDTTEEYHLDPTVYLNGA